VPAIVSEIAEHPETRFDFPSPHARARFGALAYREFRLLWLGMLVSNTGTWMAMLAQGWLVVVLSSSPAVAPYYLGLVGFVRAVPVLLLSGVAGAIIDRVDRRRLLATAQLVMGLTTLLLGILAALHVIQIWHVMLLAAISSAASAFEAPTRQSLVSVLVGKRELMNAIGLNSAAFNAPFIIGPVLGGLLVSSVGFAVCFFINAASYIAVLAAVLAMSPKPPAPVDHREGLWSEMLAGFAYMRGNAAVLGVMVVSAVLSIFARPYITLLPALARSVLNADARVLGELMAFAGAGALVGSIVTAMIGIRRWRGAIFLASAVASGIMLALLGLTRTFWGASAALLGMGVASMLFLGMTNTLLQTYTPPEMRGRVMSIYTMIFLGLMPLGAYVLGFAASLSSLSATFAVGGALVAAAAVGAWLRAEVRELA
jgi:MFS family permease